MKVAATGLPSSLNHAALWDQIYEDSKLRNREDWVLMNLDGFKYEMVNFGGLFKESVRIRLPGQTEQYEWSSKQQKWVKSRNPLGKWGYPLKVAARVASRYLAQQIRQIPLHVLSC
jgi:hypothetical protein